MGVTVIDNFLDRSYFLYIKNHIESPYFEWFFQKDITNTGSDKPSLYSYGFNHFAVDQRAHRDTTLSYILSGFYGKLVDTVQHPIIERCRVDMVTHSPENYVHPVHIDFEIPHIASVFYITDSDAETIIYDKKCDTIEEVNKLNSEDLTILKKVQPRENRLIFFDGRYVHTGSSPAKYRNRIIINTDLVMPTAENQ
jgi:hypothetical protein